MASQRDLKRFRQLYLAQDGLMKLTPENQRPPFPGRRLTTADNDNGILFLAYCEALLRDPILTKSETNLVIERLQVLPGLYNRNPGRDERHESHDNYVGIMYLSTRYGLNHSKHILDYGVRNGFTFDNVVPGRFNLRRWRQGKDIAFYKLCNGFMPTPIQTFWLLGSILFNAFQKPEKSSENLMCWLRLKTLDLVKVEDPYLNVALKFLKHIWIKALIRKTSSKGLEKLMEIYFRDPNHPCRILSKNVLY